MSQNGGRVVSWEGAKKRGGARKEGKVVGQ